MNEETEEIEPVDSFTGTNLLFFYHENENVTHLTSGMINFVYFFWLKKLSKARDDALDTVVESTVQPSRDLIVEVEI